MCVLQVVPQISRFYPGGAFFQLWEGAVAVFAFITSSVGLKFFFCFWVMACWGGGGWKWKNP